jgi:hypothetical protein
MSFSAFISLALLMAVARAPADGAQPDKTPPKPIPPVAVTRRAIESILAHPEADRVRPEYPLIFDFAQRSDKVEIVIGRPFFDFSDQRQLDSSLLAYYLAGAVKFDLDHPDQLGDRRADVPAAIRAGLVFYRKYREVHPGATHPLFQKFDELERQGKLDEFVKNAELPASPSKSR